MGRSVSFMRLPDMVKRAQKSRRPKAPAWNVRSNRASIQYCHFAQKNEAPKVTMTVRPSSNE